MQIHNDENVIYRSIHSHNMAGDTNTQNDENVTGPFMAIIWQETQIHRLKRIFDFCHIILMFKFCALMLLCYLIYRWNRVNKGNTIA